MWGCCTPLAAWIVACSGVASSALPARRSRGTSAKQSAMHSGSQAQAGRARRVALVLRGETFRGGKSGTRRFASAQYNTTQLENWRSQLKNVVLPFEAEGYQVNIMTATYKNDLNGMIRDVFGERVTVFKELDSGNQATNAMANIEAFEEYAKKTNIHYRFMILARHDARFDRDLKQAMFASDEGMDPDEHVILYVKHGLTDNSGAATRCTNEPLFQWNEPDRSSITWYCSDRLQVVPSKYFGAFKKLLAGPTSLHGTTGPMWPFECWAELSPLVGGDGGISFFREDLMRVCKEAGEHSLPREILVKGQDCPLEAR